jgi:hypothetical protein
LFSRAHSLFLTRIAYVEHVAVLLASGIASDRLQVAEAKVDIQTSVQAGGIAKDRIRPRI